MTLQVSTADAYRDLVRNFFYNPDARSIQTRPPVRGKYRLFVRGRVARPLDPFRWNQLLTLIGSERVVEFVPAQIHDVIPDHVLVAAGTPGPTRHGITLGATASNPLDAGGISFPGRWIISSTYSGVASTTDVSWAVYNLTLLTSGGTTQRVVSSLVHELFGHTYLAVIGAPHTHGATITASHNVPSPFGSIPFTGPVDVFIGNFVGHEENATYKVGVDHLLEALNAFTGIFRGLPSPLNPSSLAGNTALANAVSQLGANYEIMRRLEATNTAQTTAFRRQLVTPAGGATVTNLGDNLARTLLAFAATLSPAQQADFRTFVHRYTVSTSQADVFGARANALVEELGRRIP